jgi:hypothetical protein
MYSCEIDLGLDDIQAGRVLDGETVFANLQQRVTTQQDWLQKLTGSISDEAVFLEAMEYGSAFRSMHPHYNKPPASSAQQKWQQAIDTIRHQTPINFEKQKARISDMFAQINQDDDEADQQEALKIISSIAKTSI